MSDQPSAVRRSHRRPFLTGLGVAALGLAVTSLTAGQAVASVPTARAAPAALVATDVPPILDAPDPVGPVPVTVTDTAPATGDVPVTGNVQVGSVVALTIAAPDYFTLTGLPGQSPAALSAVTMTVVTNDSDGYNVSVNATAPTLLPLDTGTNTSSIPVTDLAVQETGATGTASEPLYQNLPLPNVAGTGPPVMVYSQNAASATDGDTLTNDWEIGGADTTGIPTVPQDTYSTTVNYVAMANS